jgi:hypothetical protein
MSEQKPKHKKPSFEPLVPLGLFLVIFGAIITAVPIMPASWLGQGTREIGEMDKVVNLVSGLAFLIWGGAWFYVGWSRTQKLRKAELQKKDEKL